MSYDNAMYYTFSTAAQALAAAFGFVAAVVLYRMQMLENEIRTGGEKLQVLPVGNEGHYQAFSDLQQGKLKEFLDWYKVNSLALAGLSQFGVTSVAVIIAHNSAMKRLLKKWFWITLLVVSVEILCCLTAIILTPCAAKGWAAGWLLGAFGVVVPLLALGSLIYLCYVAIGGGSKRVSEGLQRQLSTPSGPKTSV